MKTIVRLSLAVLALGLMADVASAQLSGLPAYNYVPAAAGVTVSGMFGRGLNNASGKANSAGGMITYGAQMFWVGAGASYFDFSTAKMASFGGNVGVNLPLGPELPVKVAVVGGVGYASKNSVKMMTVPAGVTLAIDVPSPSLSITPWVSPGIRYLRVDPGTGTWASQTKFGGSGGVSVTLPMGVGIDAALDYTNISGASPLVGGIGLHYTFQTGGSGM
jgi:hypothetical protein